MFGIIFPVKIRSVFQNDFFVSEQTHSVRKVKLLIFGHQNHDPVNVEVEIQTEDVPSVAGFDRTEPHMQLMNNFFSGRFSQTAAFRSPLFIIIFRRNNESAA